MSNMNTPKQRFSYEDFDVMKVRIASPERIREWSRGEVKKPETINYRTLKPERDGLFCEKIFGPTKDWECYCGKYKRVRYKGVVCDRCGVEVTKAKVRRERMGHIELAAPVSHIWYLKGVPSRMGLLIDVSPRNLEKVVYFAAYIVLDEGDKKLTKLEYKQVLSENEYREKCREVGKKLLLEEKCISQSEYEKKCKHEDEKVVKKEFKKVLSDSEYEYECENKGMSAFRVGMGAEAIKELLEAVDLDEEVKKLKREISKSTGQKKVRAIKRMETVSAFQKSGNEPSWMIMDCVPVIPPELRPMVQLDGGRFATSDLNDLYRRIINRNNRLRRLLELRAPEIIIRNEKRMLQEAVDSLIDNGRRGRAVTGASNRPLKSLSDMLKGKQGRFRQNLLGKRVDYSGRSVIVVGPELKFYQCGLPKQMAIELFKPFVMKELVQRGMAHNIKSAKKMIDRGQDAIWDILEEVIREHPVMLNRAPTLHRLSIQAFEPVLVEGKAIKLHPLACTPFNADFDGDQMAVHVPLTYEAQTEARFLMLSANNLLKLSDGSPVNVPTQDMVLGSYYLTTERDGMMGEGKIFKDENEAIRAYFDKVVDIEAKIKLRRKANFTSVNKKGEETTEEVTKIIDTTVGKIIFNEIIPQDLGFVDRTDRDKVCEYEINEQVSKKVLGKIIRKAIQTHDSAIVVEMLDNIKALGYHYSTISGMTISASDVLIPEEKQDRIDATTERVNKIKAMYEKGLMTKQEKHDKIVAEWSKTTDQLSEDVMKTFGPYNHIKIMADSGARGSKQQIKQLAGMRGNMAATSGEIVELPIKSCFKEGLTTLEYFLSAHGSRKSLSDTALKTADSGYLTRRLVDVAQDITIKEADCCADGLHEPNYKVVAALKEGKELIEGLSDRIAGRWSIDTIVNPETKKVIVEADHMITAKQADEIEACGIEEVKIRTALTCRSRDGVCAKCYGADMANGKESRVGEAVGIIAAQSIGEPGTQLSMETKHLGGIAGKDITQGLPRVEEIFETRKPKGDALISEIGGKIKIKELENDNKQVIVKNKEQTIEYDIRHGAKLAVEDGQVIEAGDKLTEGSINPHDILEINGPERVQAYIIKEIQRAYRLQGVDINDKHVEIICRQMLKKVRIEEQGDSEHLPGVVLDLKEIEDINEELIAKKKKPAVYKQMLLGITKSSLATSSFLSAASFQETTRVLTEAAISGRADHLKGLKENIILGKIIPAGTGMKQYSSVDARMKEVEEVAEELEAEEE